ncbi:glycoside hydrolase superfamily [Gorgonomyces haynaldii]|nr:glycoside hydrolase superfamily [Gorgonomyces haynaldii]
MGRGMRGCCRFIFCMKATLAILLAFAALGIQGYLIYDKRMKSLNNVKLAAIPLPDTGAADAVKCYYKTSQGARLLPPNGQFLFGFSVQWDRDLPKNFNDRLGMRPAIFNAFTKVTGTDFQKDMITFHAQETGLAGGILELTVDPGSQIEGISDQTWRDLATHLRTVNSKFGVPILLRFGHEMNGGWMTFYNYRPQEYIKAFRALSFYVHGLTNMTAMLWSPNTGGGYPFGYPTTDPLFPKVNDPDPSKRENFRLMDTNGDRVVDEKDDPYLPFYPGDEYVDWVGLSLYDTTDPQGQTVPVSADFISTTLDGDGPASVKNFYTRFAANKNKPFVLSETGASYQTNQLGNTVPQNLMTQQVELQVKQQWWKNIFQLAVQQNRYPLWRGAVWFEEIKTEISFFDRKTPVTKDYRATFNSTVKQALVSDMQSLSSKVIQAGALKFACDGSITNQ